MFLLSCCLYNVPFKNWKQKKIECNKGKLLENVIRSFLEIFFNSNRVIPSLPEGRNAGLKLIKIIKCVYFERSVDVVVGGDVWVLSSLLQALLWRRLHVDDVGPQLVAPHCLNGLKKRYNIQIKAFVGLDHKNCLLVVFFLTFGSMSITQIFPLSNTSLTDSMLVPYRFPLYSPYSRNLQNTINTHFVNTVTVLWVVIHAITAFFIISDGVKGTHLIKISSIFNFISEKNTFSHWLASSQSWVINL